MVLDLIVGAGEVLSLAALLCGGSLVLMETEPFLILKSAVLIQIRRLLIHGQAYGVE
jgi:hypothetical protein